jgi:hypothetical protein
MREPSEAQSVSCDVSRVRASDRTESFGERRQLDGRARANFGSPARQGARWAWAGGAKGEARAVGPARGRPPGSPTRRGGPTPLAALVCDAPRSSRGSPGVPQVGCAHQWILLPHRAFALARDRAP